MWAARSLSFLEEPCEHPSQGCLDPKVGEKVPPTLLRQEVKKGATTPQISCSGF